ncbi:carbon-nitrogen hydrolase family protein [Kitasatospora sp. NBC_00458]|uniref:carbon-nitrogen hydrolase family protein n=1 Tax=Kitasatospora sp. NBC_00458 TaxID=2903568 RepID=UPI002E172A23
MSAPVSAPVPAPEPAPLTVAVAQPVCAPSGRPDTVALNVERHAATVREAAARLVVFPEFSLTGYDLDAPAVAPGDPRLEPLVAACAGAGAVALVGAPVADPDGREYIGTLAVSGSGVEVVCRKVHLHGREVERFTPAGEPSVLELDGFRLGLAVCADVAEPAHAERSAGLGIHAYVGSTLYGDSESQLARRDAHMRDRAAAHGVWGVLSTSAGASGEYATTSGGSGVWAADGALVGQAGEAAGEIVRAELR